MLNVFFSTAYFAYLAIAVARNKTLDIVDNKGYNVDNEGYKEGMRDENE